MFGVEVDSLLREREESIERQRRLAAKVRSDQERDLKNFELNHNKYFLDHILPDGEVKTVTEVSCTVGEKPGPWTIFLNVNA